MNNHVIVGAILLAAGFLAPQVTQGQGTTFVSDLGQPSTTSTAIGSDSWLAIGFLTGTNAGGYQLDSAQLGMTNASGIPIDFALMLYSSQLGGDYPGTNLGTLTGSLSPLAGGIFTYAPGSSLKLLPSTAYFIVATAGTRIANGAYEWSDANSSVYNQSGGWEAPLSVATDYIYESANGSTWVLESVYPKFAITANAAPEPGIGALFGVCCVSLLTFARFSGKHKNCNVPPIIGMVFIGSFGRKYLISRQTNGRSRGLFRDRVQVAQRRNISIRVTGSTS